MFSVVKELHKMSLNVFSELGDLSKIDIIVETKGKLVKVQVKYAPMKNGGIKLSLRKCGPNGYRYTYTSQDVDVFAVYCPTNDKVYWIPASEACKSASSFGLRVLPTKKPNSTLRMAEDYSNFMAV